MMKLLQKQANTALIAGGSEGIGAATANYLAAVSMDILVASRKESLDELILKISQLYQLRFSRGECYEP